MRQNRNRRLGETLVAKGKQALREGSYAARAVNPPANGAPPAQAAQGPDHKFHPLEVLKGLETGKLLDGKQMNSAARALTALELRPQLRGYKQLAAQLTRERNEENRGLGKLGSELQGNVGGTYAGISASDAQGVAAQQAIAAMLNQQSGAIAQQSSDSLGKMQQGEVGALNDALALRGAPTDSTANQALSDAVAQQSTTQAANAAAQQQFASSQGAGAANLAAQMAASTRMQGGQAIAGIGRDIVGRVGESNQKYRPAIQEALGKLADVKATKGATFTKNLLGLRGEEQKFFLGKQAVKGEKEQLAASTAQAKADAAAAAAAAAADQANDDRDFGLAQAQLELDEWKAKHPNAGSNDVQKKKQEIKGDVKNIRATIPTIFAEQGQFPDNFSLQKKINLLAGAVNSKVDAEPALVRQVIKRWLEKQQTKQIKKNPPDLNPW